MCSDSSVQHDWAFSPVISLAVACSTEEEIDRLFARLSEDGAVFMPLDTYPFSERFARVRDRYGVSWQRMLTRG
jgi:predicted 3-demethylubiquinone-9 3-methyltransferase (glyoxalase superfamily)